MTYEVVGVEQAGGVPVVVDLLFDVGSEGSSAGIEMPIRAAAGRGETTVLTPVAVARHAKKREAAVAQVGGVEERGSDDIVDGIR